MQKLLLGTKNYEVWYDGASCKSSVPSNTKKLELEKRLSYCFPEISGCYDNYIEGTWWLSHRKWYLSVGHTIIGIIIIQQQINT